MKLQRFSCYMHFIFLLLIINNNSNTEAIIMRAVNWFVPSFLKPTLKMDPDAYLSTPQIISRHGYPAESHTVQTEDGYLLTMHRIPHGKLPTRRDLHRQPVFLQHGLVACSADFVLSGPIKGLAFILADAGYDVWLGNARGNTYSRAHVTYKTDTEIFWDFSWDEMAMYDLPAEIDHIGNVTGQSGNILYIGHSMGTTMFFALMSSKPEYNHKIRAMFALAPVAYVNHIKSPIRLLVPWTNDIQWIMKFLGKGEFLPQNKVIRWLSQYGCDAVSNIKSVCEDVLFVLCGFDKDQFNQTLLPRILGHTPAGTSIRTIIHYAQEISNKGQFSYYDFGSSKNMKRYGTPKPPLYNISNIQVPVAVFYADNDWLASPVDVLNLYEELPNPNGKFKIPFPQFNHIDFLWGKDATTLVYLTLMNLMRNHSSTE